ncbi:MAG: TetR/AcrR family transcriptional regulator [Solirubrobacteraceae bacterium]
MSTDQQRRSRRDRPAKAPLSVEAVVDAGLRVLRSDGLDAVTMRRVAAELDTGPASLYVYVANRDELCTAMLDRVVGTIALERADASRWREQVHRLMGAMVAAMNAHPGIARVALANIPTGGNALVFAESMLAILRAGGIADQPAAWACDILPLLATATAIEGDIYAERIDGETEAEAVERVEAAFAALPPERFPNLAALVPELTSGDGDARFAFAVDCMLDGLLAASRRG